MSSYLLYSCLLFSDLIMASFNPLVTILNQNKLIGSNYVDWKRNLDIVLTAEEHKYVLTQPCPSFPSLDAPFEEKHVGNMHIHSGKLNGSTSFTIYNMHYVNFRIQV